MNNTFISELKANTFSDITFNRIDINGCSNLKTIDRNAFNGTDLGTYLVSIGNCTQLNSPDNSTFEILNKFNKAMYIYLTNHNITEIPSNAFRNKQDYLETLVLSSNSFKKLGNNAFSVLKSLKYLDIIGTSIDFIPENAFEFYEKSNDFLHLGLKTTSI